GKATTPLAGFTITVSAPPASPPPPTTGSATLGWSAPTTNSDGTPLTDLSGYLVQYGNSPTLLSQRMDIQNPSATSATASGLGSGPWYFAVVAYSASGSQSAASNVASKTIP